MYKKCELLLDWLLEALETPLVEAELFDMLFNVFWPNSNGLLAIIALMEFNCRFEIITFFCGGFGLRFMLDGVMSCGGVDMDRLLFEDEDPPMLELFICCCKLIAVFPNLEKNQVDKKSSC